ncbi:hypothetical protein CONPUDRAFT_116157 [Coniophora puteana RWD-64-598 SS2]|uniref:Uncharacterized protein n=1 Tax=Coniophora puteana (strain RWD-64-598) TaxID=741705 RepID=A0A5M3N6N7_CONPW|nr:uncharacterized protein CONPUDRAFT_116157 [Coniophora puteana RWD-64-598 SS2]EIW87099.1 hypothetical protein CONPUDRAFT_116157 [Coniophora puteana RWD-64-598 SS2]
MRQQARIERSGSSSTDSSNSVSGSPSRTTSRAASPSPVSRRHRGSDAQTRSSNSSRALGSGSGSGSGSLADGSFHSPLYRVRRAPLLRVFVPSPEGVWLSDKSVEACEAELHRAGVAKLLRAGDVVWDAAVGDEGNVGRLVWDGSYLVDLDYKFSRMGELSPYFHSLAFSPSYFHRVIRQGPSTGTGGGNPIVYVDVSPWGPEISTNMQLFQDRVQTEMPDGTLHSLVRWVHRSRFTILPPRGGAASSGKNAREYRVPIPGVEGFVIDPSWYGSVVLEAEGTNEGLADLQGRAFPSEKARTGRRVWRVVRERSVPGEMWLRAVTDQERVM